MLNTNVNVGKMVRLAVLVAIIVVMAYVPWLGYLRIGPLEMTTLVVPVAIAAVVVGPGAGMIAGGVFGLTSFLKCFGQDPLGTMLLNINPVFMFIVCMAPRIIAGLVPGLIYKLAAKKKEVEIKLTFAALSSLSAAIVNTLLFIGSLYLFFGNTKGLQTGFAATIWVAFSLVMVNAIAEVVLCGIVGTAVSQALIRFVPEQRRLSR